MDTLLNLIAPRIRFACGNITILTTDIINKFPTLVEFSTNSHFKEGIKTTINSNNTIIATIPALYMDIPKSSFDIFLKAKKSNIENISLYQDYLTAKIYGYTIPIQNLFNLEHLKIKKVLAFKEFEFKYLYKTFFNKIKKEIFRNWCFRSILKLELIELKQYQAKIVNFIDEFLLDDFLSYWWFIREFDIVRMIKKIDLKNVRRMYVRINDRSFETVKSKLKGLRPDGRRMTDQRPGGRRITDQRPDGRRMTDQRAINFCTKSSLNTLITDFERVDSDKAIKLGIKMFNKISYKDNVNNIIIYLFKEYSNLKWQIKTKYKLCMKSLGFIKEFRINQSNLKIILKQALQIVFSDYKNKKYKEFEMKESKENNKKNIEESEMRESKEMLAFILIKFCKVLFKTHHVFETLANIVMNTFVQTEYDQVIDIYDDVVLKKALIEHQKKTIFFDDFEYFKVLKQWKYRKFKYLKVNEPNDYDINIPKEWVEIIISKEYQKDLIKFGENKYYNSYLSEINEYNLCLMSNGMSELSDLNSTSNPLGNIFIKLIKTILKTQSF